MFIKLDPQQEKENAEQRLAIEKKIKNAQPLNQQEQYFYCKNITLDACRKDQQCEDEYYARIYIHRRHEHPLFRIEGVDRNNYMRLVRKWEERISNSSHLDKIFHPSASETKEEIKTLRKEYPSLKGKLKDKFDREYFELLAWSRYRYGLVKEVFENEIKYDFYTLKLNDKEIRFDPHSYTHILTRHFAHGMKPYSSKKDHFYEVFSHDKLHLRFEQLFAEIDKSGLYASDPIEEINFRYKDKIYKIYINEKEEYSKGVRGPKFYYRLQTFFPVSQQKMLDKLMSDYSERQINAELSIFVRKPIPVSPSVPNIVN